MKKNIQRSRGRPRSFDRDQVLEAAITIFWRDGYEGASLDKLTEAMGINRPSLYAAFGNKHDLFMAALNHYAQRNMAEQAAPLLSKERLDIAIHDYLRTVAEHVTKRNKPAGCLIACVAMEIAERDQVVADKIRGLFEEAQTLIAEKCRQSQIQGDYMKDIDPDVFGRMIVSIAQSLAARARLGESRAQLLRLADEYYRLLFAS